MSNANSEVIQAYPITSKLYANMGGDMPPTGGDDDEDSGHDEL